MSVQIDLRLWKPSDYKAPPRVRKRCGSCGKRIRGKNHDAHCTVK